MNPFRQQIGIFYKDREWADVIRDALVEDARDVIQSYGRDGISFIDGSTVRFCPDNDLVRGYRWTKVYIQDGIDKDVYETIIAPKILPGVQCFVIYDYYGLTIWGEHYLADRYYFSLDRFKKEVKSDDFLIESFEKEYECIWGDINENNNRNTN